MYARWCFFLFLSLSTVARAQTDHFRIEAIVDGGYEGPIVFITGSDTIKAIVREHKVSITGQIPYPMFMSITVPGSRCGSRILAENSTIRLLIQAEASTNNRICMFVRKVSGSVSDSLHKSFIKQRNALDQAEKSIYLQKLKTLVEDFVTTNPKFNYNAAIIGQNLLSFGSDWGEQISTKLHASVLNSPEGTQLQRDLKRMAVHEKGRSFQDFSMKQFDGRPFSSASLKGKYVLYDFWASWCAPCRKENPKLLASYRRYKEKGFEIVGISLDNQFSKWMEAIAKDELSWIQISDLKGWQNELAAKFQISAIPYNIFVSPDGKIISTDLRPEALSTQLKEIFGE